jgi:hypothetical protein
MQIRNLKYLALLGIGVYLFSGNASTSDKGNTVKSRTVDAQKLSSAGTDDIIDVFVSLQKCYATKIDDDADYHPTPDEIGRLHRELDIKKSDQTIRQQAMHQLNAACGSEEVHLLREFTACQKEVCEQAAGTMADVIEQYQRCQIPDISNSCSETFTAFGYFFVPSMGHP